MMQNTRTSALLQAGQRLWLDNLSRTLLQTGTLAHYVQDLSITGLTSNVGLFAKSVAATTLYDASIGVLKSAGLSGSALVSELALEDFTQAAEWLRPIFDTTCGVDGWVSLGVSPELAYDAKRSIDAGQRLHAQAALANLMVKIPGTAAGISAAEALIIAGVPVYVTHLYSPDQFLGAAQGYMRALERRSAMGLDLKVGSVAALVISRWDAEIPTSTTAALENRLGIAIAQRTYQTYREVLLSDRWRTLEARGARPQALLWSGLETAGPAVTDTFYVDTLVAADTIQCMTQKTLLALADHGRMARPFDGATGEAEDVMTAYSCQGVNETVMAARLQRDDLEALMGTWSELLALVIDAAIPAPQVSAAP